MRYRPCAIIDYVATVASPDNIMTILAFLQQMEQACGGSESDTSSCSLANNLSVTWPWIITRSPQVKKNKSRYSSFCEVCNLHRCLFSSLVWTIISSGKCLLKSQSKGAKGHFSIDLHTTKSLFAVMVNTTCWLMSIFYLQLKYTWVRSDKQPIPYMC